MFWTPEADPAAIVVIAAPSIFGPGIPQSDLVPVRTRLAPDGLIFSHGEGAEAITILLVNEARPDQPLAAIVPLDANSPDRIEALTRLWRALHKRSVLPDTRLTAQQRRRLKHMLQAVDGRMNGANYRDIANALYGRSRVAADPWKSSALRDSTMDLVKDGLAMIAGGYLKLMRHRRRP